MSDNFYDKLVDILKMMKKIILPRIMELMIKIIFKYYHHLTKQYMIKYYIKNKKYFF